MPSAIAEAECVAAGKQGGGDDLLKQRENAKRCAAMLSRRESQARQARRCRHIRDACQRPLHGIPADAPFHLPDPELPFS